MSLKKTPSIKSEGFQRITPWLTTKRVEALADGVFAIAMTLMVLNIKLMPMSDKEATTRMWNQLVYLWPHFYAYGMSFVLLSVFWIIHHKQFHSIKRVNEPFLWINLIMLMFIVLIPFTTSLKGEYETNMIASLIFSINMLAVGMMLYLNWWYASKGHRLIDSDIDNKEVKDGLIKSTFMPVLSVVAIGVSFIAPAWSSTVYLVIPVIFTVFFRSKGPAVG